MKHDISVFSQPFYTKSFDCVIGTHPGIFHMDDVLAVAMLCLHCDEDSKIAVTRSREPELLKECDPIVDVGGGKFDHHQIGGNGIRPNGIPYASAGLVWNEFGELIIHKIAEKADFPITPIQIREIHDAIDSDYIQVVDANDNGHFDGTSVFDYIPAYLPDWSHDSELDFNRAFEEVLGITISILRKIIFKAIEEAYSFSWIFNQLRRNHNGILELPAQTFPWKEHLFSYNMFHKPAVNFVVFPYPTGGWAAQCVPPSEDKPFDQRIPFPQEWAGQTTKLPEISGISDATFCHNNCFFARANTFEGVLKLCEVATKSFEE